jgi:S1-C subfamily serine protease
MNETVDLETKKRPRNGALIIIFIVIALVFSMLGSMSTVLWFGGKISFLPSPPASITKNYNGSSGGVTINSKTGSSEENVVAVAEQVSPAVVKIDIIQMQSTNRGEKIERVIGYGSGFVISPDGYIITNNHVVEKSDSLKVTFKDGKTYEGKIIGTDSISDLAVIKIKETDLTFLKMANSDEVKVGQGVVAIGNPYGYEYTVTTGVVSGVEREITPPKEQNTPDTSPFDFGIPFGNSIPFQQQQQENQPSIPMVGIIQTDAAINPGNSGGPLVNLKGEVIGVNFLINAQGQGLGFAISSNTVSKVKNDLIEFGKVSWPSLGITITTNNSEVARQLDLRISEGTVVVEVPAGNARTAGIKKNDVILGVDGKKMITPEHIITYIRSKNVGDTVKVEIDRLGKKLVIDVKLQELNINQ